MEGMMPQTQYIHQPHVQQQQQQQHGSQGVQGHMHPSSSPYPGSDPASEQHAHNLRALHGMANNDQQRHWLANELRRAPLQPGQSPLHWTLWREYCGKAPDIQTAWHMATEAERRLNTQQTGMSAQVQPSPYAQPGQQYQQYQQPQQQYQVGYGQGSTVSPSMLHAGHNQGATQAYGAYPQPQQPQYFAAHTGGAEEDPRQGGHAHMHNASPPLGQTQDGNGQHPPLAQLPPPQTFETGSAHPQQQHPPLSAVQAADSIEQASTTKPQPRGDAQAADPPSRIPSPFSNLYPWQPLGASFHTNNNLRVTSVNHAKRPVMSLSAFSPHVHIPMKRFESEWDSSAFHRRAPTAQELQNKRNPVFGAGAVAGPGPSTAAKHAAAASGSTPSKPAIPDPVTMTYIRTLIKSDTIRQDRPVELFKLLRQRVSKDGETVLLPLFVPDPTQMHEILIQLKNHASPTYLSKVGKDEKYALTLRRWLQRFGKEPKEWEKCMAPLLQILARIDMPVNYLTEHKFGKYAKSMVDKAQEAGVSGMNDILVAFKQYERKIISQLGSGAGQVKRKPSEEEGEGAAKKQKTEGTAPQIPGPDAKPKVETSGSNGGPSSSAAATSRVKLPDIKKRDTSGAPVASSSTSSAAAIQPSASPAAGLLASTMNALRQNNQIASVLPPAPTELGQPADAKPSGPKPNKKGHMVRFIDSVPDGGALEEVKLFKEEAWELERPPWQDDPDDLHGKTAHQLDMAEGRALRIHESMEPEVEWYEPVALEGIPDLIGPTPEVEEQEARERGILGVVYNPSDDPPEPNETGVKIITRTPDTGNWYPLGRGPGQGGAAAIPPAPNPQPSASVTELLGSLNRDMFMPQPQAQAQVLPATAPQQPYGGGGYSQHPAAGQYDYGYGQAQYPQQGYQAAYDQSQGWQGQAQGQGGNNDYRRDYDYRDGGGGYGGGPSGSGSRDRGRGRDGGYGGRGGRRDIGNRRGTVVCKHWLKNDCHRGENCTFRHSID